MGTTWTIKSHIYANQPFAEYGKCHYGSSLPRWLPWRSSARVERLRPCGRPRRCHEHWAGRRRHFLAEEYSHLNKQFRNRWNMTPPFLITCEYESKYVCPAGLDWLAKWRKPSYRHCNPAEGNEDNEYWRYPSGDSEHCYSNHYRLCTCVVGKGNQLPEGIGLPVLCFGRPSWAGRTWFAL